MVIKIELVNKYKFSKIDLNIYIIFFIIYIANIKTSKLILCDFIFVILITVL